VKRIGILTAGGDTPALNATIQGAVTRANEVRVEVVGLIKGFNSLFNPRCPHVLLNPLFHDIPELDPCKGGTIKSHLGVLSREFRIPCLMAVEVAGIADGDRVRMESSKPPPDTSAAAAKTSQTDRARIWKISG
jgi:hypothetical protein